MDCLKYEGRTYRPDVLYGKIQQNPEYFVRKHNLTEAMLNSDVSNELDFHIGSDENAVLRLRGLLGNLSKEIDADLYNELADVYRKYSTTDVMNANDFKQHFEGRLDKNVVDELVSIKRGFDAIKKREVRRKIEQRRSELREEVRREYLEKYNVVDTQGNRVDINGKLVTELIHSIDELTDDDFSNPSRTVRLPALSATVDSAIGANGKPVIIKKNIFEKNAKSHKDLSPDDSRMILDKALYDPTLYGQNQKAKKPHRWIVIHLADRNASVVLEVNNKKDNVEIVNWHFLNEKGIEKVKKQALREDGQLLILPSENSEEAGALSSRTQNLSDTNIQNDFELGNIQVSENGNSEVENKSKSDYRTGIRTHIDRMRRGEHSEETMMALDRLNRLYEVENQERAIDETNAWFDELAPMGYNGLRDLNLVREFFEDGYFKGGMLVAMYKNIFEGYEDYIHFYKSHNDIEQMNFYIEKQSTFIGAFDNEIRQSARVLSMLRRLYELDPRYAKRELERDFVRFVGREMNTEEKRQMELYYEEDRSIAKEIEEAMEGLEEAESKALAKQLAEKGRALETGKVSENDTNKAKAIADKIRQLKIKDNMLNAIAIPQALYNGALEITATAIEGGAKLYDAVRKGVQYIKKSGWYKRLSKAEQIEAVNEYRNLFESINDEAKELIYLKDDGSVSVPIGKLMEYAMNGKSSIMEIAEAIKVDMFGDNDLVSAKLIKDSIMGYYRKQPRNSNEVRDKIKEMKDIQRLIDQIVSIENGTYIPKRKERKEPVSNDELLKLKKTALQKRLRELMKQYDGEHKKQLTDAEKSKSNEKRLARMIEKAESDLIDLYNGILPMNEQSAREMSDKELELQDELSKKRKEIAKLKKEIEDANGTTEAKEVSAKEKMLERMKRKLEQDISDLERGIKQEVGNRKREVMSERITELEREIKELKADKKRLEKEQGITDEKELERYKKIIEAQQRRYERMLAEKNFYLPLPNKHPMNKEVQRLKRKRDDAKDKYMEAWLIARRKNRGWGRIIGNYVLGFFNTIRGSHATGDLSAIGIQGGFAQGYLIAQKGGIRKYIRALKRWNSIFNSKAYDRHLEEMKTHPMYELMKQTGVRLTEATAMSRVQEEGFFHNDAISMLQSRLDKGLSRFGMKTMSIERGTSAFLNQMRIEIFTLEATRLMNEGKTFETHPEEFNLLAMTTNTLTGAANYRWERNREDVANINGGKPTSSFTYNPNSKYSGLTELSSILLYSGRLMTSQLNMINPTNYFGGGSATTRKMYRQAFLMNLVTKSVSIGLMTFFYNATLKAYLWANREEEEEKWGVPIEDIYEFRKAKITLDWRDTDFGTITMRNMEGAKQQYNLWGGTKSMVVSSGRLLSWGANIATSNKYNIHSYRRTDEWGEEELKKLNESGYSASNVLLGTLFENKLAPGIGLVYGMASGNIKYTEDGRISIKRFGKDVFSFENVAPMSLSTLNDLYQTDVIRGMSELSDDTNGFDIFDAMIVVGTMTGGVNFKHEHKPFLNAKKAYEEYKAEELEWGEEPMEFEDFIKS